MRGQVLLAVGAVAAMTALAPAASAQSYRNQSPFVQDPYCAQVKQNRMMVGGAIGALAGAVLGNNVAARNAQTEGAVLGGVAGAAAGAAIGRGTAKCDQNTYQSSYPNQNYGGYQNDPYQKPTYGSDDYRGYPQQTGYGGGQDCRWGSNITRDPDGREVRESVYMCRGSDGVWRRQ
jgi:uncharacterized protein YcfJ